MGWGTYLVTPLYFSKDTFKTKYEVEKALKETRESISIYKDRLKAFALMTEPQKFCPKDIDAPLEWLEGELSDLFEALEEVYTYEYKLLLLHDAWDRCHDKNGNAIVPNKPLKVWDMDFCGGDFITEVYPDGTPADYDND